LTDTMAPAWHLQALMLARSERGTEEELLTVLPDRIQAHGERLWKASVTRIHVSSFHLVPAPMTFGAMPVLLG
jgi:hypothetical protein